MRNFLTRNQNSTHSVQLCNLYASTCWALGHAITWTFYLLTSNTEAFILVPKCTNVESLVTIRPIFSRYCVNNIRDGDRQTRTARIHNGSSRYTDGRIIKVPVQVHSTSILAHAYPRTSNGILRERYMYCSPEAERKHLRSRKIYCWKKRIVVT